MSTYVVVRQAPMYQQLTFEDFLKNVSIFQQPIANVGRVTSTRTDKTEWVNERLRDLADVEKLIRILEEYNAKTAHFHETDDRFNDLYRHFKIPKRSGGLRPIDAPNDDFMEALRELKFIFENQFGALYHTSAYAYVNGRCAVDAIKRHQANESKWFGKFDFHNFFGSTTFDFAYRMFSMIFPFSLVVESERGAAALRKALSLCFLNGGLPQGTPASPLITNVMMIPLDHYLSNKLRNYNNQSYVYTRYADDMQISSRYDFNIREIENLILEAIKEFDAPFKLNTKKTRYGSSSGSNWNLGVLLTKENEITVGHARKKQFQSMLTAYIRDKSRGVAWDYGDIQTMEGLRNYYRSVEKDTIDRIIEHINKKYGVDVVKMVKEDLAA